MEENKNFVNSVELNSAEELNGADATGPGAAPVEAEQPSSGAPNSSDTPEAAGCGISDEAPYASPAADLENLVSALTAERDLLKDQMLRLRADFDNFRKRMNRELEKWRATAAQETIRSLLPVRDNLERALSHDPSDGKAFAEGIRMILQQFDDTLAAQGLEAIDAEGQDFDPNVHEALTYAPSPTVPSGKVAMVYERGYRLGDTLLRPAKVVVSSGPPDGNPAPEVSGENGAAEPVDTDAAAVDNQAASAEKASENVKRKKKD